MKITLPIYWTQTYKTKPDKTVLVGLNFFRNAHHHTQNKLKSHYSELVHEALDDMAVTGVFTGQYKLLITLYYKNPTCDGSNITSMIEKFVLDAFQEYGVSINDNVRYHVGTTWELGGRDKENPRCTVKIIEYNTKGK